MRIGLYFGSFNPIHIGHVILAETARIEAELDRIWLVVSPQNPFKEKKNLLPEFERYRMAELAVADNPYLEASNVEFSLPRPSYTIDTLTHLRDRYRSYEFALIMGQDNLQHLHKWKNSAALLKHYPIYVYPRIEAQTGPLDDHPSIQLFQAPLLNISATYIRQRLKAGKSIRYLVPDPVHDYIMREGIYQG